MDSIIVPVDLARRGASLLSRVLALVNSTASGKFEVVVAHADRGQPLDKKLCALLASAAHVTLVSEVSTLEFTNVSRLRNIGVAAASGEILLLLDADIAPDLALLTALCADVAAGAPLSIAPCLYLSKEGTRALERGASTASLVQSALGFSAHNTLHWAVPSSVMAVRKSDYLRIGGFFEAYHGHGYEDFDFMLRLVFDLGICDPSLDYLLDRTYRAPLLSRGFRAELGALCISNLLDGRVALHKYHHNDNVDKYYQRRAANAGLFRARLSAVIAGRCKANDYSATPSIISVFYRQCRLRNIEPDAYFALFDARPRYLVRRMNFFVRWGTKMRARLRAST